MPGRSGSRLRRKLHVAAERLCQAHAFPRLLQTLLARDAQLVLQMNVRGRQEHVNAGMRGVLQRLPRALDVELAGAGQAGNRGPTNAAAIARTASKSPSEAMGNRLQSRPHRAVELVRHAQLLVDVHAAARRLLAVPQRGVKDRDSYSFHDPGPSSGVVAMVSGQRHKQSL